jgi:hypothetical protein
VDMTATPAPLSQHDLEAFFHAVGHFSGERGLTATPQERAEPDVAAELLDAGNSRIDADPMPVAAFVDGIQAALVVTHRDHRPVYLNYVAAGAVGGGPAGAVPLGLEESLTLVCSTVDREWADEVRGTIPVEELPVEYPPDVERAAVQILGGAREQRERALVEDLVRQGRAPLVLDGSLVGRPFQRELVGVVKTTRRKYLADERCLFGLPAGWRSPRFKIPAGTAGSGIDRYSCYLRMVNAEHSPWNFGLIRLESFDPDLLDPLAARCLLERQSSASGDARWDRHLTSIRAVEEFLRSCRPGVYAL